MYRISIPGTFETLKQSHPPTEDQLRELLASHLTVTVQDSRWNPADYTLHEGTLIRYDQPLGSLEREVDGQLVTFLERLDPHAKDPWPRRYWQRAGHSVSYLHHRHPTLEGAVAQFREDMYLARFSADTLTREAYEELCAQAGVEPSSDEDCAAPGVFLGEFHRPEYPVETVIRVNLRRARGRAVQAERRAKATPRTFPSAPTQACARCGRPTSPTLLMTSNLLGPVCPDCYDTEEAAGPL